MKEYEYYSPEANVTNVLEKNNEFTINSLKFKTKKSRRLIKKSTWIDSLKPTKKRL